MTSVTVPTVDVSAVVLTAAFQIRGIFRGPSGIQAFFNDETQPTFSIFNANVLGVSLQNPAAQMFQAEMVLRKRACHAVIFEGTLPSGAINPPPNITPLIAYTDNYAILGKFRLESGALITNFAELPPPFIAVTELQIFALFQARPGLVGRGSVALMRKDLIRTCHRA